jgi:hypothetical protein
MMDQHIENTLENILQPLLTDKIVGQYEALLNYVETGLPAPLSVPITVNFSVDSIIQSGAIPITYNTVGTLSYYLEVAIRLHKRYKDSIDIALGVIKTVNKLKTLTEAEGVLYDSKYCKLLEYSSELNSAVAVLSRRYETVIKQYEMLSRLITAHERAYGINPDRAPLPA